MRALLLCSGLLLLGVLRTIDGSAQPRKTLEAKETFAPTVSYASRTVRGFRVLVSREAREHPKETGEALKVLDTKLAEIGKIVPTDRFKALKRVTVWLEWEAKPGGAAEYHTEAEWLKENGYNPDKLHGVEINNARNFVAWQRDNQPYMVLHELAHSYHQQVVGFENPSVLEAYREALKAGKYGEVDYHVHGGTRKRNAYAATDHKEYFAELTEAYFGENDFYPFNATELRQYDPMGYELMERVWGKPRRRGVK